MIMEAIQGMNRDTKKGSGEGALVVLQIFLSSSVMALAHKPGYICTGTLTQCASFGSNVTYALRNQFFASHFNPYPANVENMVSFK